MKRVPAVLQRENEKELVEIRQRHAKNRKVRLSQSIKSERRKMG